MTEKKTMRYRLRMPYKQVDGPRYRKVTWVYTVEATSLHEALEAAEEYTRVAADDIELISVEDPAWQFSEDGRTVTRRPS